MARRNLRWATSGLLVLTLCAPSVASAAGQSQTPPPQTKPTTRPVDPNSAELPVDMEAIRSIMDRAPTGTISFDSVRAKFYVLVSAHQEIKFSNFVGNFDLRNGPVPKAGMTHAEFLNYVTPKELYSAAGIKPTEALQFALTNAFGQFLVRKAIEEIKKASSARQIQDIRDRIAKELAALNGVKK